MAEQFLRLLSKVIPLGIRKVLEDSGLSVSDIDWVIPHQPNINILKVCAEKLGLPFEKMMVNLDKYANTSGGTIPILLDETQNQERLKKGILSSCRCWRRLDLGCCHHQMGIGVADNEFKQGNPINRRQRRSRQKNRRRIRKKWIPDCFTYASDEEGAKATVDEIRKYGMRAKYYLLNVSDYCAVQEIMNRVLDCLAPSSFDK
jgi:hypothetical protein